MEKSEVLESKEKELFAGEELSKEELRERRDKIQSTTKITYSI